MKRLMIVTTCAAAAALVGCTRQPFDIDATARQRSDANAWLVTSAQQQQVEAGIIRGATIYPYHFATGAAELNDLGYRDLHVLAGHFQAHAGVGAHDLNVRQGEASDELYKARVDAVTKALTDAGLKADQVAIADDLAGGDGLDSPHVLVVLQTEAKRTSSYTNTQSNDVNR